MRPTQISLLFLMISLAGCAVDPVVPPEPDEFDSLSDEFSYRAPKLLDQYNIPGAAVGLIIDGEVVFRKGFGFADVAAETPVTPTTAFSVGALSTMFVGWGTLRQDRNNFLVEDLPIEDQVSGWQFPPSEFDHSEVTIGKLLRHEGGTSVEHYVGYPVGDPRPTLVGSLNGDNNGAGDVRIVYPPGSETRYSDGGFSAIQLAISESVIGTDGTFELFMLGVILRPLGMPNSDFRFTPSIMGRMATPYDENSQPVPIRRFTEMAAEGLMTTLGDLLTYAETMIAVGSGQPFGLFEGLTKSTLEGMTQSAVGPAPVYERAHQVRRIGKVVTLGHVGSLIGWTSHIQIDPFRGHAIVVLTNSANGAEVDRFLVCRWYEELAESSPAEFCAQ